MVDFIDYGLGCVLLLVCLMDGSFVEISMVGFAGWLRFNVTLLDTFFRLFSLLLWIY